MTKVCVKTDAPNFAFFGRLLFVVVLVSVSAAELLREVDEVVDVEEEGGAVKDDDEVDAAKVDVEQAGAANEVAEVEVHA